MAGSITTNPRDVRVTPRTPTPRIRIGSTDAPDAATYNGRPVVTIRPTHRDRSMRHVVVTNRDGFVDDVRTGRDAPAVSPVSDATSAPNADDRRHGDVMWNGRPVITRSDAPTGPSRRWSVNGATGRRVIVDDNENGGVVSPRSVRLVSDGDAPLPRPVRPVRNTRSATGRTAAAANPRVDRLADVRAFAAAHGIAIEKLADKRVVAAIRDVMAHRASVAAYAAR